MLEPTLELAEYKVLPYVVEGRKSGAAYNFSVGPKGRFLGIDQ
jgi:hypothetical protein